MHVNNVLPANGIDDAELVVAGRKKLVKRVARMVATSAAGDVESKKRPRCERHSFKCVSANCGDGKGTRRLVIEPSKLIIGLQIKIERFGIGRQPRAQSVTGF